MEPQTFVRLSIGALGLRLPATTSKAARNGLHPPAPVCMCEIKLKGFPIQTACVPVVTSSEADPQHHGNESVFYLEESDVRTLLATTCFHSSMAHLEISVFMGGQGSHCGMNSKRHNLGVVRVAVSSEWCKGKPLLLLNGWVGIGKSKVEEGKMGSELHLRIKLDPDPRYVFQFEDETDSSPQIVQIQGTIRQSIFSCKFNRERRSSSLDLSRNYWTTLNGNAENKDERRERKGWKVVIHDLCGSAVAAAFMVTPFVPATGCDHVARSNPGAWLVVRPDPSGHPESWCPWGRLDAWRESGTKDFVYLKLHLLPEGQEAGILLSETLISTDKGGEFIIDMDRQTPVGTPLASQQAKNGDHLPDGTWRPMVGGFVMNCRVQGEGKSSKPLVQLAMRHVTCIEDAAIFMALAAAVDLSVKACRPFRRRSKRIRGHSF